MSKYELEDNWKKKTVCETIGCFEIPMCGKDCMFYYFQDNMSFDPEEIEVLVESANEADRQGIDPEEFLADMKELHPEYFENTFYENVEKHNQDLADQDGWFYWNGSNYWGPEGLTDDLIEVKFGDGAIKNARRGWLDWSDDEDLIENGENVVAYRLIKNYQEKNDKSSTQLENNKYDKKLVDKYDNSVSIVGDVYTVLEAFDVRCPALQHAGKKILNPGKRGHKDVMEDLVDIRDSVERAIELEKSRG